PCPLLSAFHLSVAPADLRSFPTRRSSDLRRPEDARAARGGRRRNRLHRRDRRHAACAPVQAAAVPADEGVPSRGRFAADPRQRRSEEHTSELQSLTNIVCRLLLAEKNLTT